MLTNILIRRIGKIPPWLIYFVSPLPGFVESIFSLALPNVGEFLGAHKTLVQFSTVSYYLGFSLGILTLGWISDLIGRRPLILGCLISYALISLFLSYADNIYLFIFFRFLHAYAASVCSVVGQAMIRDSYSKLLLSYMYVTMSLSMSLIPALGYIIGGQLIQIYSWTNAFRLVSFCIFTLFLVCFYCLPETNYIKEKKSLLINIKKQLTVLKYISKDLQFFLNSLIVGLFNGVLYGFYMQAPFIFIKGFDIKTSVYGQIILFTNFASFLGAFMSKYLMKHHFHIKQIKIFGLAISFCGSLLLFLCSLYSYKQSSALYSHILSIIFPFMICALGHSLLIPLVLSTSLKFYRHHIGIAGSIFGSFYYLISALVVFSISKISKYSIDNFSILCLILGIFSIIIFTLEDSLSKRHKM
ncbi:MAG: Bcr/CflA family efflux MFS transporter [Rickettsia sp.]|nr:Bcr/CflA family efflux MFS transporter [Rickettsia sp.]